MSLAVLIPAIATGVFGGAALLLPTLAVALLYQHGRYVPLWLPDLGLIGAYAVHVAWTGGVSGLLAWALACGLTIALAWVIHRTLIARFLSVKDFLSPLLVGLGLSQMFQAVASFYGSGMSQHYPDSFWAGRFYSQILGTAIYWVDLGYILVTLVAVGGLYGYLHFTNWGLKVRMVMSNPDDARKLGLPVRTVDAIVLGVAAVLMTAGATMRGIRFDLQPSMMFYPGLAAIAACIVATPGHRLTALGVIIGMEIVASLVGTVPSWSAFQRAVPFAVLLVVLVMRAVFLPRIRRYLGRRAPLAGVATTDS